MSKPQPPWLSWPPHELAAAILPWFASNGARIEEIAMKSIAGWLNTGSERLVSGHHDTSIVPFEKPDVGAVAEAIQVLDQARLLMRATGYLGLTRLGMHALRTNSVRQHLGLSDASPT
jgi:hypothetical protein